MNVLRQSVAVCLVMCVSVTTAAAQVAHVVDQATLERLLTERATQDQDDRATIQRVLSHPQVEGMASRLGVDLVQARTAVSTLDGSELQTLAAQAVAAEDALAGGQSITLSTTTIIIGLLVLILLIVALK